MRIKKYVANTVPEVMKQIRVEMGQNAVILNSRAVKTGGWFGLFGKKKVEVIAAVEEAVSTGSGLKKHGTVSPDVVPEHEAVLSVPGFKHETFYSGPVLKQGIAPSSNSPGRHPVNEQAGFLSSGETWPTTSTPKDSRSSVPGSSARAFRTTTSGADTTEGRVRRFSLVKEDWQQTVLQEIQELKENFYQLSLSREAQVLPSLRPLVNYLLTQEFQPALVYQFVHSLWPDLRQEAGIEEAQTALAQQLVGWLNKRLAEPISEETRMVYFVGPTGVGKTTTIAKLAAEFSLHRHKKVGLITTDTYRVAAVEQLKTYAGILDIPLEVAFSVQEINEALKKLSACDLFLMDTAGRNYLDAAYISELAPLLTNNSCSTGNIRSETYLVLSATTKTQDLVSIYRQFQCLPLEKLIWTKVDETTSYGNLFNLLYHTDLHLAYLTNGQSVPDDIKTSSAEEIVAWVMEGFGHE